MFNVPILDENGVEVPDSWSEGVDKGALTFFGEEACPTCRKSRRFYVADLRCYGCVNPPAPAYGEVAPDLATAQSRDFSHYAPSAPCTEHPSSPFHTTSQRCTSCESAEASAAHAERTKQREETQKREHQEYLALRREENRVARERNAEAKKAERSLQLITRTVRGPKRKTLARAAKMEAELTPTPKPKRKRAATGNRNPRRGSTHRKRSRKADA